MINHTQHSQPNPKLLAGIIHKTFQDEVFCFESSFNPQPPHFGGMYNVRKLWTLKLVKCWGGLELSGMLYK